MMALLSDSFVQQSVRYPLRRVNNTATVPISQYHDRYGAGGGYYRNIEHSMTAAIYDGAMIANLSATSAAINPQCSTGNCTFPTYASLAVSSECLDVSTLIKDKCVEVFARDCSTEAYLPNKLWLRNEEGFNGVFAMSSSLPLNTLETHKIDWRREDIADISVILYEVTSTNSNDGGEFYNTIGIFAYDCIFSFCVQTFDAVVSQGQFSETVVQTYHMNYTGEGFSEITIPQDLIPHGSNLTFGASFMA